MTMQRDANASRRIPISVMKIARLRGDDTAK
jgi:hypothetical protein